MRKADRLPRIWSPMATQDLLDIWEYLAHNASTSGADEMLRSIDRTTETLETLPHVGRVRDDVRDGLRSVRAERYVLFYRVTPAAIEIVRVLDERRDVDAVFDEN